MASNMIDPYEYSFAVSRLREFFTNRGFIEVHTQSRLSILAACEDPRTIATYNYGGQLWPLPQTGQMWLEHELLNNPQAPGFFCISTSFRNEPNPVAGRHDLIFPMFEFETRGGIDELRALEEDMLVFLGFGPKASYVHQSYLDTAEEFDVSDITGDIEGKIEQRHGPVFFLEGFPLYTSRSGTCARTATSPTRSTSSCTASRPSARPSAPPTGRRCASCPHHQRRHVCRHPVRPVRPRAGAQGAGRLPGARLLPALRRRHRADPNDPGAEALQPDAEPRRAGGHRCRVIGFDAPPGHAPGGETLHQHSRARMTLALAHRLALVLPPALAHRAALRVMAMGWPVVRRRLPAVPLTVAGVTFPNPLGLAAGFDKNAVALPGLAKLGFGHVEIGTVTRHPQAGNTGRTLFRLGADRAVINRLGMPNDGADAVAARIGAWRAHNPDHPMRIGASVGQNRDATDVADDIAACVARLGPVADYVVVNLSSPNTAGLRDWQAGDRLARVLDAAAEARERLPRRRPLFVKIAPDLEENGRTDAGRTRRRGRHRRPGRVQHDDRPTRHAALTRGPRGRRPQRRAADRPCAGPASPNPRPCRRPPHFGSGLGIAHFVQWPPCQTTGFRRSNKAMPDFPTLTF